MLVLSPCKIEVAILVLFSEGPDVFAARCSYVPESDSDLFFSPPPPSSRGLIQIIKSSFKKPDGREVEIIVIPEQ